MKSLNDKWIAGGDFKTKTFFEDFLFLDKASRNIGDVLYLDIFELKRILNKESLNKDMSVYTFIASLLIFNKFVIMNLPAYVNFYNVQNADGLERRKPEGSLEFADKMWGTYLGVDYRDSGPKFVCFFTGKPSNYADLPESKNFLFNSDGIRIEKQGAANSLNEDLNGKKDYALSNRVVGFNVDIGVRNQNIFSQFTVSQDNGKGTTESVTTLYNMIQRAGGRETSTQNVSLYNYYLNRSYGCQIVGLGNALIQPTMYFNLRHVPMFNGPYLITDVQHVITPGSFQTTFSGVRQGIYDLPSIDNYLQSINQNLLTKLEEAIRSSSEQSNTTSTNSSVISSQIKQDSENAKATPNSCKTTDKYSQAGYTAITATESSISIFDLITKIKKETTSTELRATIFTLCYLRSFKQLVFDSFNYNYALIETNDDYLVTLQQQSFAEKNYVCVESKTSKGKSSIPVINFKNVDLFIGFMVSRLKDRILQINDIGIHEYYITEWSNPKDSPSNFQTNRDTLYITSKERIYEAMRILKNNGIQVSNTDKFVNGKNYTQIYPTPTPTKAAFVLTPGTEILKQTKTQQGGNDTIINVKVAPNVGNWKIEKPTFELFPPAGFTCTNGVVSNTSSMKVTDQEWNLKPFIDVQGNCPNNNTTQEPYIIKYTLIVQPITSSGAIDTTRQSQTKQITSTITI
jgi:hypothetical protein